MEVDLDDVVDVQLPAYRGIPERDPEEWHRPNWRRQLVSWMFARAQNQLLEQGRYYDAWGSWRDIDANGLPGLLGGQAADRRTVVVQ
ncbi:hypothetical protein ABZU45_42150 [Streptomyces avermitilis]|uniref:hypothetical protein n=1 Tax=Streptomyces avermitilis TaxID=33903 RepID=UPI0033BF8026